MEILSKCKKFSICKKKEIKISSAKGAVFKIIRNFLKENLKENDNNKIKEIQEKNKISKAKNKNYIFCKEFFNFTIEDKDDQSIW